MTKGTHLLRSALLALLALAVISGGSLAAGDLFDDDYKDCPHKTRLRDGQIADLSVNRDSDDEDHVNVAWSATDPATWGLGSNAYSTSLVVILDDGSSSTETLSLGSRKTTFEGVETGVEVTVQMAIVVDTADGKYLISDILEKSINQSLTEPSFSGNWYRVRRGSTSADTPPDARISAQEAIARPADAGAAQTNWDAMRAARDFQYDSEMVSNGVMYYIGYNENFANYTEGSTSPVDYVHVPTTQRLRIGLAHSEAENDGERDDVDFEAYIIRIADEDGDVVVEGDDVSTVANNYGSADTLYTYDTDGPVDTGPNTTGNKTAARKLFVDGLADGQPVFNDTTNATTPALQNVRIVDGSDITVGMHLATAIRNATATVTPSSLSIIKVGVSEGAAAATVGAALTETGGEFYADPPDEYRNFPIDTLSSDVKYTITAWAVNEDDEVISPVAKLIVRPINERVTLGADPNDFQDYLNTTAITEGTFTVTEFTVIE